MRPTADGGTGTIIVPKGLPNIHHEVELGVVIGEDCAHLNERDADDVVGGYVLALDMTARELQSQAKEKGQPWTQSKCYDTFTPMR